MRGTDSEGCEWAKRPTQVLLAGCGFKLFRRRAVGSVLFPVAGVSSRTIHSPGRNRFAELADDDEFPPAATLPASAQDIHAAGMLWYAQTAQQETPFGATAVDSLEFDMTHLDSYWADSLSDTVCCAQPEHRRSLRLVWNGSMSARQRSGIGQAIGPRSATFWKGSHRGTIHGQGLEGVRDPHSRTRHEGVGHLFGGTKITLLDILEAVADEQRVLLDRIPRVRDVRKARGCCCCIVHQHGRITSSVQCHPTPRQNLLPSTTRVCGGVSVRFCNWTQHRQTASEKLPQCRCLWGFGPPQCFENARAGNLGKLG